jgi:hypothetical protein
VAACAGFDVQFPSMQSSLSLLFRVTKGLQPSGVTYCGVSNR